MISYEEVKNTPFTLVERENEVLITIGNQICDPNVFENKTEAKKYINKKMEEVEMYAEQNNFVITNTDSFNYKGKIIVCVNLKSK